MTNIATALKTEIARLSRKTLKEDIASLRAVTVSQRKQIASLKAQLAEFHKMLARLEKGQLASPNAPEATDDVSHIRFSAKGLAAHRQKLGLSAQDYAKLIGVSTLSIYKWESGKAKPRRAQLQALTSIRGMGKRAALAKLSELADV